MLIIVIILFFIFLLFVLSMASSKSPVDDESKEKKVLGDESLTRTNKFTSPEFYTSIAGVAFRNTADDIGGFLGYVCSDPSNSYDKNAIAIYRNDNKLLGYIPKEKQKEFREWSTKENLPCVGYIKDGDEVELWGKVKILDTDKEETDLEMIKFVRWLISKYGKKFIPYGFNFKTETLPRTKNEWLDFLDEYIEEKENKLYN